MSKERLDVVRARMASAEHAIDALRKRIASECTPKRSPDRTPADSPLNRHSPDTSEH
jgi:hypothetical protein